MRMLPEVLCSSSIHRGKRFPGKPSISIQFLQKTFGAGDGRFSDGEIGTSKYALHALSFGKEGWVFLRLFSEPEEMDDSILFNIQIRGTTWYKWVGLTGNKFARPVMAPWPLA